MYQCGWKVTLPLRLHDQAMAQPYTPITISLSSERPSIDIHVLHPHGHHRLIDFCMGKLVPQIENTHESFERFFDGTQDGVNTQEPLTYNYSCTTSMRPPYYYETSKRCIPINSSNIGRLVVG